MSEPKVWRYRVRTPGYGWGAVVYIEESGLFTANSDWGVYGHLWTCPGCPIREFVAKAGEDAEKGWTGYLLSKIGGPKIYDAEATVRAIRDAILEARRYGPWKKGTARDEWELVQELEDEDISFEDWHERTLLDEPWDLRQRTWDSDAVGFCKHVMPELARMIRAELEAEKSNGTNVDEPAGQ